MAVHEVFAYLTVKDAPRAIAFYEKAFGAREKFRLAEPSGRIGHAELLLGNHTLMLADEFPEYGLLGPETPGRTGSTIHLHVDDCDELMRRAVELGATTVREPQDQFYGERSGRLRDPFGHEWLIGHSIEEVTPEEMQRRYTELLTGVAQRSRREPPEEG